MTLTALGSTAIPRLICSQNNGYPLIAIGGDDLLRPSSIEQLGRELARTLSFMADRFDMSTSEGSDRARLIDGFWLYSLVCEIREVHLYAHFVSRSDPEWVYHAIQVTTVSINPRPNRCDFSLMYLLTWVREHTIRMSTHLDAVLNELSDVELAECRLDYLRPLPMFKTPPVRISLQ